MSNDFDDLLEDILKNPELILDKSVIDDNTLIELQKRINPYVCLTENYDTTSKQAAVCSYTNLREDYLKRFTMTSLIGFLFQMLYEYNVPKNERVWKSTINKVNIPFTILELEKSLENIQTFINNLKDLESKKTSILQEIIIREDKNENTVELNNQINDISQSYNVILHKVTNSIKAFGILADSKLQVTKTQCKNLFDKNDSIEFLEYEFPEKIAKNLIYSFLKQYLSFDPSIHIRNGLNKENIQQEIININNTNVLYDSIDPNRLLLETLEKRINAEEKDKPHLTLLTNNKYTLNAAIHILRDENLHEPIVYMLDNLERFKYYLLPIGDHNNLLHCIPPQDTFHRWNYFNEVNYEELRTITETIYPDKSDLDWAIAIWKIIKGTDEEINEQFMAYCQKHHDMFPSIVKLIDIGNWTFLADFKENRKNVQFYNKHTEVLKRIIDRHSEDKKIGAELMRNRIKQEKAKNIAEHGPDAPGLKMYKNVMSQSGKDLVSKGVEKVISAEEMKRLEKAKGNIQAAKELEVLEDNEKIIKQLDEVQQIRQLTNEEEESYNLAKKYIERAKEMLAVPDDSIQVDVFTTNAKTGDFTKTHFYTKSEEALSKKIEL